LTSWLDVHLGRKSRSVDHALTAAQPDREPARVRRGDVVLDIRDLGVKFGGVHAVDGASLTARAGEVTGLIGPNGAGKTTTFNVCSGLVKPDRGQVVIAGIDISRRGPARRARTGLGRTFQQMQLFEGLTVWDNVALGAEAAAAGHNPLTHLVASPADSRMVRRRTAEALRLCELGDFVDTPVSQLSTGQRRLVDLARCLAGEYAVLLLDEPSSGLDQAETDRFAATLRRVVEERGIGVVLVEHNLSLVLELCSSIYVLDFGKLLFSGTPDEVAASPVVQAAYLGDSAALNAVSDAESDASADLLGVVQ
ncbi:MAG: ABC transporter ATP-binding protein, partial [Aeromicrobium sp.]